jgi:hypothetical protein
MSTSKNRSHKKKPAASAQSKTDGDKKNPSSSNRTPREQLARFCATQAQQARGADQDEWFLLGHWIGQYNRENVNIAMPQTEQPKAAAAGAGR